MVQKVQEVQEVQGVQGVQEVQEVHYEITTEHVARRVLALDWAWRQRAVVRVGVLSGSAPLTGWKLRPVSVDRHKGVRT